MTATPATNPASLPAAWWRALGPGFLVAATGVGAGDLIAAGVAGSRYGLAVLWAVVLGALFKWVLNEGVARWQLATGTTLIEGWSRHLPRAVSWYFVAFLFFWGFLVAAALASACGLAAHALWPVLSVKSWGALHAVAGFILVRWGRYQTFERIMQVLVGVMFVLVLVCAGLVRPEMNAFWRGLVVPEVPAGAAKFLLGVIGGVGGSVTLLCYGYWIREKGWSGRESYRRARFDLTTAYALSGAFGAAMIVLAAAAAAPTAAGGAFLLGLADQLGTVLGPAGRLCFVAGFWCAVFTSLLGVWQGVPYLFADFQHARRRQSRERSAPGELHPAVGPLDRTAAYRWFLAYLAFPPLVLLLIERPLAVVVAYAIAGSFFMPFLAGTLLLMNNRAAWVGPLKNPWPINLLLVLSLGLFAWLFASVVLDPRQPGAGG